jgi:cytochrome P450
LKNPFRGRTTAEMSLTDRFHQKPFEFLDREFPSSGGMVQTGIKEFSLGDPLAARSVLLNQGKLYEEDSDFFTTRIGLFGPRDAQLNIRRDSRALLRNFLAGRGQEALTSLVKMNLPAESDWPDTGNRLVYRYLRTLLLAPDSPPKLLQLLDDIVERAVLKSSSLRRSFWRRRILQFRVTLLLSDAIEARQALGRSEPLDLLDVVAHASDQRQNGAELAEVFLAFVMSIAGSLGFVLGWSIYLLGTHPVRDVPPEWVVQEALRLWPVAWRLPRRPAKTHQLSGVTVDANHRIVACPYLVHRNPEYWSEPGEFRPERWATPESWRNPAFIPFGHGPHRCVAADLSMQLISKMLETIMRENVLSVASDGTRPMPAPAMAPPPYRLTLRPRT